MTKFYKLENWLNGSQPIPELIEEWKDTVILGNTYQVLDYLPAKSVNLCVTSPPYYGKRFYNTVPQLWGGKPDCDHEWLSDSRIIKFGKSESSTIRTTNDKHAEQTISVDYATCTKCGCWKGELGQEPHFKMFINNLYSIFQKVKRILKDDGQLWINIGDTYYGSGGWGTKNLKEEKDTISDSSKQVRFQTILTGKDYKHKSKMWIPHRLAIKMTDEGGWIGRNDVIWEANRMPSSAKDRFSNKYENFLFFVKNGKYFSNLDSVTIPKKVKDPRMTRIQYSGKSQATSEFIPTPDMVNPGDVWYIPTANYGGKHFATYPEELIRPPIIFACPKGGIVLDPFGGTGTTALVAKQEGRHFISIELNEQYVTQTDRRFKEAGNLQYMHGKNVRKYYRKGKKKKRSNE